MPTDYSSGGAVKISWHANNISAGNVKWQAQLGAITQGDVDTPLEHALSTAATVTTSNNTAEARRLNDSSITLNMDGAVAGDLIELVLFRDSADASDTYTTDAEFVVGAFEYTSA